VCGNLPAALPPQLLALLPHLLYNFLALCALASCWGSSNHDTQGPLGCSISLQGLWIETKNKSAPTAVDSHTKGAIAAKEHPIGLPVLLHMCFCKVL
jgi:hypothetical protein